MHQRGASCRQRAVSIGGERGRVIGPAASQERMTETPSTRRHHDGDLARCVRQTGCLKAETRRLPWNQRGESTSIYQ